MFNTGHPHTHVVIRGRDDQGRDLVIARDYIGHGVRARAQALMTLELGPESELERLQKLASEVEQERFTRLDRALLARAKDGILVAGSAGELAPAHQTMQAGRLKTLERLGLAEERRPGVWALDAGLETKLRQLGERADTYRMMERALKQAGIERGGPQLAVFERGRRTAPVIGKVVAVGLVDEITDRQYVIVDGADGRVHYAELGRLRPDETPGPRHDRVARERPPGGQAALDAPAHGAVAGRAGAAPQLRRPDLARPCRHSEGADFCRADRVWRGAEPVRSTNAAGG